MQAKKQIPKPQNRQDFETLCKKLRGEIWCCPEIKKNGRQGQSQCGVDIYGMPRGEINQYYGIQCKGKDDYAKAQLTSEEIDVEIEKAKNFKPKLKKLYFTTTANKDVNIEEYVRGKNIEHIKQGLFEMHLYCREDIVDLIEENNNTYNRYINNMNIKNQYSIVVEFAEKGQKTTKKIWFLRTKKTYRYKLKTAMEKTLEDMMKMQKTLASNRFFGENKGENLSEFGFQIRLTNTGTMPLENYKIYLNFEGDIRSIHDSIPKIPISNRYTDCYIRENSGTLKEPKNKALVPKESHCFDTIYMVPESNGKKIKIKWEFLSNYHNEEGELSIDLDIKIKDHEKITYVDTPEEEKEETVIEDFYWDEEWEKKMKDPQENKK